MRNSYIENKNHMTKIEYRPELTVLYVEDDETTRKSLYESLIRKRITAVCVGTLFEALDVLKKCDVRILVSDGMFPKQPGSVEEKCFIPLVQAAKEKDAAIQVLAWSNSTHVHEYCLENSIPSFSKIPLDRKRFEEKGREYIDVVTKSPDDISEVVGKMIIDILHFSETVGKFKFESQYTEPATVLGFSMAGDMRTALLYQTAGKNYAAMISKIDNGVFDLYLDSGDDSAVSKSIADKILKKNFFPTVKSNVDEKASQLLEFARSLRIMEFEACSNSDLAGMYLRFRELFMEMRMYSSIPTALEHTSGTWTKLLRKILTEKTGDEAEINRILSVLTTPERFSYTKDFEIALIDIAIEESNGSDIDDQIERLREDFEWINYTFEGERLTGKDIREKIGQLILSDQLEKTRDENRGYVANVRREKEAIFDAYVFSPEEKRWFDIGSDIVFIKYFRKGVFAESYYCVEFLLEEIGRRIGCSRRQVSNLLTHEVLVALALNRFDGRIVDLRMEHSILFFVSGMTYVMPDSAAKYLNQEETEIMDMISGQAAFVGKVTGIVKIVNIPSDMDKVNEGDVLVSRSTNPSLVSAMRKSAAFVTDLGGLTCHAAIIAREMRKPCVIGTKSATKVLHDGDLVEVDANNGVVRIIRSA